MTAPRKPADVPEFTPLEHMAQALSGHRAVLVDVRHGLGRERSRDEIADHALAAVAIGKRIASAAAAGLWCDGMDALAHGATLADVAAALDLPAGVALVGLHEYVDGQARLHRRYGDMGMSPAQADEARALIDGADQ
ncbi:hypothetical protein [Pseudonocardia sp. NPDC049635]|uniref:hypothetical protein n=1 Tax=Pseudonocardia sp. NPDC049635 TaxID=3155506 RepID=UPI003410574F